MSGKLDQSLEDIVKTRRQSTRNRRGRNVKGGAKTPAAPAAPVGGVKKTTRPAKLANKATASNGPSGNAESKAIISNLPADVSEDQIKDYFAQTVGPIKKVLLTYGPNGQSRGVATIIFTKPDGAAKAAKDLNGVKVDGRAMKIEVVLSAKDAPAPVAPKSLTERISNQPKAAAKAQPKPATATKAKAERGAGRGRGAKKGRAAGRPKPKSAAELDAEMVDYFGNEAPAATVGDVAMATNGGAVQPAAGGDTGMDEDIM